MSRTSLAEVYVAKDLQGDGWDVFNTNRGFPDLFCVRQSEIMFVEVKCRTDRLKNEQSRTIARLKSLGFNAEIKRIRGRVIGDETNPQIKEIILAKRLASTAIKAKCPKCGHEWGTKSTLAMITCPYCSRKSPKEDVLRD